jgi:hypothetical protein
MLLFLRRKTSFRQSGNIRKNAFRLRFAPAAGLMPQTEKTRRKRAGGMGGTG